MKKKMPNRFHLTYTTKNPERGCEVMDWLVENDIEHTITLERGAYVFAIIASRLQATKVHGYFA